MQYKLYSVYDSKIQLWTAPQLYRNKGEALRAFTIAANEEKHHFNQHAADFTLMEIGTWDDEKGQAAMHDAKENLGCALEHRKIEPLQQELNLQ